MKCSKPEPIAIRLAPDRPPVLTQDRTDQAVLLPRRRCCFGTIRTERGPSLLGLSFGGIASYQAIVSSAGQYGCRDHLVVCHFDVPEAARSTVSWSEVRGLGPLIDHTRQTVGPETLDLPIYNLAAQNEGGPDPGHWTSEGHPTSPKLLSWV